MKRTIRTARDRPPAAQQLLDMVRQGQRQLEDELAIVNGLNVFPVPDGDTGANMLATVREALLQATPGAALSSTAEQLAAGALLGARGNSGVILSQLFRGLSEAVQAESSISARCLSLTFARAAELAYAVVSEPVEGTMLSVLEAIAQATASPTGNVLRRALAAAEAAVARTPEQLPLLREAQVVDSGGYGLLMVLRGWYQGLCGEPAPVLDRLLLGVERVREQVAAGGTHPADLLGRQGVRYGYCVTLLVDGATTDEAALRRDLTTMGDSVLVVAIDNRLKLHVHVPDPDVAVRYAAGIGRVVQSEISNIDEQTGPVGSVALPIVAVAQGEGLARIFRGLGATVLEGGPGRNPSTGELLAACDAVLAQYAEVFLLPNNANVLGTAYQAAAVRPRLHVVAAKTIPQGIGAVLAYDSEDALKRMTSALDGIVSAELVFAARAATLDGIAVDTGDIMVLVEGRLVGSGQAGLAALANRSQVGAAELCTIYYGAGASAEAAERLRGDLVAHLPHLEIEIVRGDQPQPLFLLSFE